MNKVNNINTNHENGQTDADNSAMEIPLVISVLEEQLIVDKKTIETGKVQIRKTITEEEVDIDVSVLKETNEIKKIPKNIYIDSIPEVRQEGNVTIIPVVHEILVVEKKLMLVEEIHVVKNITNTVEKETVIIKKQQVDIKNIINGKEVPH